MAWLQVPQVPMVQMNVVSDANFPVTQAGPSRGGALSGMREKVYGGFLVVDGVVVYQSTS